MQRMTVQGGQVVELAQDGGPSVVDDGSARLRDVGVPVEAVPMPAGLPQKRDELGGWM